MSGHTPGPWFIKLSVVSKNRCIYSSGVRDEHGGYGIGEAWDLNGNPENAANARLIAAAPDLLEALVKLVAIYDDEFGIVAPEMNAAIAAIAKATIEFKPGNGEISNALTKRMLAQPDHEDNS